MNIFSKRFVLLSFTGSKEMMQKIMIQLNAKCQVVLQKIGAARLPVPGRKFEISGQAIH